MPHPPPHIWVCPHNWSLQPLYLHYNTMLWLQINTFAEMRVGWPSHSANPEGLYLSVPCMHLNGSLLWQPRLLWGRMHRGAATDCGIGVRLQVVKSERFFIIHYRPPLLRSLSSRWFDLQFCLALLEHSTAGWQFGVCFSLSLCLLVFIPHWLITLLLAIFFLCLLIVFCL